MALVPKLEWPQNKISFGWSQNLILMVWPKNYSLYILAWPKKHKFAWPQIHVVFFISIGVPKHQRPENLLQK